MSGTSITPDAAGLKALAHPHRLQMLGLLRTQGPATATGLAQRLGLNSGATSYHLRQLAEHGFIVEDTERGNARERWWRAAHDSTRMSALDSDDPDAADAYLQTVALMYGEHLARAARERPFTPRAWQESSTFSDWVIRLTPANARALIDAIATLVEETEEDDGDESASYVVQLGGYLLPGQTALVEDPSGGGPSEAQA